MGRFTLMGLALLGVVGLPGSTCWAWRPTVKVLPGNAGRLKLPIVVTAVKTDSVQVHYRVRVDGALRCLDSIHLYVFDANGSLAVAVPLRELPVTVGANARRVRTEPPPSDAIVGRFQLAAPLAERSRIDFNCDVDATSHDGRVFSFPLKDWVTSPPAP